MLTNVSQNRVDQNRVWAVDPMGEDLELLETQDAVVESEIGGHRSGQPVSARAAICFLQKSA